jgi:hypothetical protein
MKAYGGVDIQTHVFLASVLVGDEWSASRPGLFILGEKASGTHWLGGWVCPRAGLDYVEKILDLTGTRTLIPRSSRTQPVAIPTTLSRLFRDEMTMLVHITKYVI